MTNGVDAGVDAVQAPIGSPPKDRRFSEAAVLELRAADHTGLLLGDRRHPNCPVSGSLSECDSGQFGHPGQGCGLDRGGGAYRVATSCRYRREVVTIG
jgi:hypothetical protein